MYPYCSYRVLCVTFVLHHHNISYEPQPLCCIQQTIWPPSSSLVIRSLPLSFTLGFINGKLRLKSYICCVCLISVVYIINIYIPYSGYCKPGNIRYYKICKPWGMLHHVIMYKIMYFACVLDEISSSQITAIKGYHICIRTFHSCCLFLSPWYTQPCPLFCCCRMYMVCIQRSWQQGC